MSRELWYDLECLVSGESVSERPHGSSFWGSSGSSEKVHCHHDLVIVVIFRNYNKQQ